MPNAIMAASYGTSSPPTWRSRIGAAAVSDNAFLSPCDPRTRDSRVGSESFAYERQKELGMSQRIITPAANHLRRRAKALRKEKGIPLHNAQELLAREAGFANWHAFITNEKTSESRQSLSGTALESKRKRRPSGIAYYPTLSKNPLRRPPQPLMLDRHREVGLILQHLRTLSRGRAGVHNRISVVASMLDDWLQHEYDHRVLPYQEFLHIYYGSSDGSYRPIDKLTTDKRDAFLRELEKVEQILTVGYIDCKPRDLLLKEIHFCRVALDRWYTTSQGDASKVGFGKPHKRREIPAVKTSIPVAEMRAPQAVEHAIRLLSAYLEKFGSDWKRSAQRDALYNRMRLELPYVIHETKSLHTYILVNRDYKPVGMKSYDHVDYEQYPNLHIRLTPERLKTVVLQPHTHGLFDDGTTPWRKRANAQAYLGRLRILHNLIS